MHAPFARRLEEQDALWQEQIRVFERIRKSSVSTSKHETKPTAFTQPCCKSAAGCRWKCNGGRSIDLKRRDGMLDGRIS